MKVTYTIIFVSFVLAGIIYGRLRIFRNSTARSVGLSSLVILAGIILGVASYYLL